MTLLQWFEARLQDVLMLAGWVVAVVVYGVAALIFFAYCRAFLLALLT